MGGMGSGRAWYYGAKDLTEDYLALDIRRLNKAGVLKPGKSFGWSWLRNGEKIGSINISVSRDKVDLNYRSRSQGEDWDSLNYPVYLSWTECNYGGQRPWFLCPARGCGRRVAVLFGGKVYACRHCYQLAYPSQRENVCDRSSRRADKIRDRLGWEQGILNSTGGRPKGMHWKTYFRLRHEYDCYSDRSCAAIARFLWIKVGLY